MDAALIAFAIPLFFGLIGVEHLIAKRRGAKVYVFADSIADLSCGIGEQVLSGYLTLAFLAPYAWVVEHERLAELEPSTDEPEFRSSARAALIHPLMPLPLSPPELAWHLS